MVICNLFHLLTPIILFLVNVLFQVISFRTIPRIGLLNSEMLGFGFGFFGLLIIEISGFLIISTSVKDFISILIVNVLIYSSLGYCYYHFINMGETARRIRMLREIYESKDGLSLEEVLECYNASDIVEVRISRLINSGQIVYRNGKYYIGKPIVLLIAKIILIMKLIILAKKSEFD